MSTAWALFGGAIMLTGTACALWIACGPWGPAAALAPFLGTFLAYTARTSALRLWRCLRGPRCPQGHFRPPYWTSQDEPILKGDLSLPAWKKAGQLGVGHR